MGYTCEHTLGDTSNWLLLFLPISLLIMVYYRRKRLKNRRNVYSTGDRNNSTVQMRTISLQNYQHPGRPRQNSNYALQTAQVVSSPSYGGQQVVRAIPIGANTARVNSRQQRQTNTTTTDFVSTSFTPNTCAACATDVIIT